MSPSPLSTPPMPKSLSMARRKWWLLCIVSLTTMLLVIKVHQGGHVNIKPSERSGLFTHSLAKSSKFTLAKRPSSSSGKSFQLQHCPVCKRSIKAKSKIKEGNWKYEDTTCGWDAFRRGGGQKVVGFSFYGNRTEEYELKKGYFAGIKGNLELMPRYYPGWTMRVYFDLEPDDPIMSDLCDLACHSDILDLCHAGDLPGTPMKDARLVFPMNWRFFPTLDPQVDIFVCRDLDSRFSDRERSAVSEWLERSDQPIHSMRDHKAHFTPLLGAAWGSHMERKNARRRWKKSWLKMLEDPLAWASRRKKGPDQQILANYVWPWGKRSSIQHDSYLCQKHLGSRPFPTQRKMEPNNHIASVFVLNTTYAVKCPVQCRPKNHKDWEYC